MKFDRNKLVFEQGFGEYWEFINYIEDNMPYSMLMDIGQHNPRLDTCKTWLYEHGKGTWALEVVDMQTLCVRCSDKQDALMVKLKFGGR